MNLLKIMLKASGKKGVPQGGVISPLLSNLYLNEVDRLLERAREVTRNGRYTYIEYARFATMDLMLKGRAAWNIVTSLNSAEARNFGRDDQVDPRPCWT